LLPRVHQCECRGQYLRTTLIDRYGSDKNVVDLRLELAAGCPKIAANKIMDLCGVYYPPTASVDEKPAGRPAGFRVRCGETRTLQAARRAFARNPSELSS